MSKYRVKREKASATEAHKKVNWKLLLLTLISIVFFFTLYQVCVRLNFIYIVHIYGVFMAVFALGFGILNRGFSRFDPKSISFPKEYSETEIEEAVRKEEKRRLKAKYLLIPLIGILMTLAFDMVYLVYLEPIVG